MSSLDTSSRRFVFFGEFLRPSTSRGAPAVARLYSSRGVVFLSTSYPTLHGYRLPSLLTATRALDTQCRFDK